MSVKTRGDSGATLESNLRCLTCNHDLATKTDEHDTWQRVRRGTTVEVWHCADAVTAFGYRDRGPHHTARRWPPCWKCGSPLGCTKCAADNEIEVLCTACLAWGTLAALIHNGPLSNDEKQLRFRLGRRAPPASEYPHVWRAPLAHSEHQFADELHAARGNAATLAMLNAFSQATPLRYAEIILGVWEKRQEGGA